jgi:hypothetical protein
MNSFMNENPLVSTNGIEGGKNSSFPVKYIFFQYN